MTCSRNANGHVRKGARTSGVATFGLMAVFNGTEGSGTPSTSAWLAYGNAVLALQEERT